MELIGNINHLLGDDLKQSLKPGARLKVAASCFSMYAFEALKTELEGIDELSFIFTAPTFVAKEATDKIRKERREFHIPKLDRERSLYGSEFEIQLRNKLTQRAVATSKPERIEQNGVKRPGPGKCLEVWEWLGENGNCMPKDLKPVAEAKGWNLNNAQIELYQWRKFSGIAGRQAKAVK